MNGRGKPEVQTPSLRPLVLKAEQVAELLGISVRSVWRFSSAGELPGPISIGRSKRWDRRTIEEFIRQKAAGEIIPPDDLFDDDGYPHPTAGDDADADGSE